MLIYLFIYYVLLSLNKINKKKIKEKPAFAGSSGVKSVFRKLRFRDGVV